MSIDGRTSKYSLRGCLCWWTNVLIKVERTDRGTLLFHLHNGVN